MFDIELDLVSQLSVVRVPSLELEINQQTEVVVEPKQIVLLLFVVLQNLLEVLGVLHLRDVSGSAVEAVSVVRGEWLDEDTLLLAVDRLVVVQSPAVIALQFALFHRHHDVVRQAQVHERVHSAPILFKHFSLRYVSWEVSQDESVSAGVGKSQKFQCDFVSDLRIHILVVNVILHLEEKWVVELLGLSCEFGYVVHDLCERDDWNTHIDTEPLDDLVLERVRGGEEDDLRVLWPSLQEVFALIGEHGLQHFIISIK